MYELEQVLSFLCFVTGSAGLKVEKLVYGPFLMQVMLGFYVCSLYVEAGLWCFRL